VDEVGLGAFHFQNVQLSSSNSFSNQVAYNAK
jgi:hypothetical protein